MRPGQNKRMRGRNNNNNNNNHRKGPNPLTRSYESNGPDVKIRGNAHHIAEKYLQLARDAQSSGDPVMAESYLQHAEHYFRLIAAAQQAQQQAQMGYNRPAGEETEEADEDDDFAAVPDRFASPVERAMPQQAPAPQAGAQPPYPERPYYNNGNGAGGGERQPFEPRQDRPERGPRPERPPYQERPYQERPYQERHGQPRDQGDRNQRRDRPQRDFRTDAPPASEARTVGEAPEDKGLPAFITAPVRIQSDTMGVDAGPDVPGLGDQPDIEGGGFHLRPRRRRRGKPEGGGDFGSVPETTGDPVD